ncbi:MAG: hypothetical protein FWB83_09185 [Treponema sp.]|nr:hypothetical protein [Treponema sp.]
MKMKHYSLLIMLTFCGAFLYAQSQSIDGAIFTSSTRISRDLPAGVSVAVVHIGVNMETDEYEALDEYVINELNAALQRIRRVVPVRLDQDQLANIIPQMRFIEEGKLTDESARAIGQALEVQQLITGTIRRIGADNRFVLHVVDTANTSLRREYSTPINFRNPIALPQRPTVTSITVTGITITPAAAIIIRGTTGRFTAAVSGTNNPPSTVTWSVTGSENTGTFIGSDGTLTVAADEAGTELAVTAVSTVDANISSTVNVSLTNASVTSVTVMPGRITLDRGKRQNFTAVVSGSSSIVMGVTWSVTGASSSETTISPRGSLFIAANETGDTLTVTATSTFDTEKSGTAVVVVLPPPVNWVSVEASVWGAGIRYERSLGNIFALGVNGFWQSFDGSSDAGVLAAARVYPGNSVFYLELGLGYGYMEKSIVLSYQLGDQTRENIFRYNSSGFIINPSVGLRFGRRTRGFFVDAFFSAPIMIGAKNWIDYDGGPEDMFNISFRYGVGAGYAW